MGLFNRFKKKMEDRPYTLTAPLEGTVVEIKDVKDPAFASEELGKGVGITSRKDVDDVCAPVSGEISVLFSTLHAIGITTEAGVEILIHIGVDTVNLEGRGFDAHIKQGQKVQRGEALVSVQFKMLEDEGYDMTVMMVIGNTEDYKEVVCNTGECVSETEVVKLIP